MYKFSASSITQNTTRCCCCIVSAWGLYGDLNPGLLRVPDCDGHPHTTFTQNQIIWLRLIVVKTNDVRITEPKNEAPQLMRVCYNDTDLNAF